MKLNSTQMKENKEKKIKDNREWEGKGIEQELGLDKRWVQRCYMIVVEELAVDKKWKEKNILLWNREWERERFT